MKKCTTCSEKKDENDFSLQRRKMKNGESYFCRRSECRNCYNDYMRRYLKNKESHKKLVKKSKIDRRKFISDLKLKNGCKRCGYNKCSAALHFHHINKNEKDFEISWAANKGISVEKIQKEIDKCIILCSNCHMEIEHGSNS